jgi:hypothetical protein
MGEAYYSELPPETQLTIIVSNLHAEMVLASLMMKGAIGGTWRGRGRASELVAMNPRNKQITAIRKLWYLFMMFSLFAVC